MKNSTKENSINRVVFLNFEDEINKLIFGKSSKNKKDKDISEYNTSLITRKLWLGFFIVAFLVGNREYGHFFINKYMLYPVQITYILNYVFGILAVLFVGVPLSHGVYMWIKTRLTTEKAWLIHLIVTIMVPLAGLFSYLFNQPYIIAIYLIGIWILGTGLIITKHIILLFSNFSLKYLLRSLSVFLGTKSIVNILVDIVLKGISTKKLKQFVDEKNDIIHGFLDRQLWLHDNMLNTLMFWTFAGWYLFKYLFKTDIVMQSLQEPGFMTSTISTGLLLIIFTYLFLKVMFYRERIISRIQNRIIQKVFFETEK